MAAVPARAEFLIQPNDAVAICGDSITEQRAYSALMEAYLVMCQPTAGQHIFQLGWSGEKAGEFLSRLDTDLYPFHPTVATTCYGMNDGRYLPMTQENGDTYRSQLTQAVESLKRHGVRVIVVGSPGVVDPATFKRPTVPPDEYNKTLAALSEIARDIARKEGVGFADVHGAMSDAMAKAKAAYGSDYPVAGGDGIHPGFNGHLVMAYAFLKALGCGGEIGTITVDFPKGRAEGTPGQKILSVAGGTVNVESTRYPFCFRGDPAKPEQTEAAIVRFTPFNQDLNRYRLVVKGLPTAKAKVTWGAQSLEFSAADLAQGVNLAEAFPANPFSEPFAKVLDRIFQQQAMETVLVKSYLHNVPQFKEFAAPDADALERIGRNGIANDKKAFDAVAAAVVPVRHAIKIEPVE